MQESVRWGTCTAMLVVPYYGLKILKDEREDVKPGSENVVINDGIVQKPSLHAKAGPDNRRSTE